MSVRLVIVFLKSNSELYAAACPYWIEYLILKYFHRCKYGSINWNYFKSLIIKVLSPSLHFEVQWTFFRLFIYFYYLFLLFIFIIYLFSTSSNSILSPSGRARCKRPAANSETFSTNSEEIGNRTSEKSDSGRTEKRSGDRSRNRDEPARRRHRRRCHSAVPTLKQKQFVFNIKSALKNLILSNFIISFMRKSTYSVKITLFSLLRRTPRRENNNLKWRVFHPTNYSRKIIKICQNKIQIKNPIVFIFDLI